MRAPSMCVERYQRAWEPASLALDFIRAMRDGSAHEFDDMLPIDPEILEMYLQVGWDAYDHSKLYDWHQIAPYANASSRRTH